MAKYNFVLNANKANVYLECYYNGHTYTCIVDYDRPNTCKNRQEDTMGYTIRSYGDTAEESLSTLEKWIKPVKSLTDLEKKKIKQCIKEVRNQLSKLTKPQPKVHKCFLSRVW
jgi:hypothetical protein